MLAIIFAAGVLHGLGPDHVAAIAAIAGVGSGFQRITSFAVRFALGHALTISLAASAAFFGRRLLPLNWERNFDLLAGGLLVLAGIALIVGLLTKRISLHSHSHHHHGREHAHMHLHFRLAARRHAHTHGGLTVLMGALFAVGGSRAMLAATPILLAKDGLEFLLRVGAFTAGIIISMILFGAAARKLLGAAKTRPAADPTGRLRRLSFLTASLCVVAGAWTILSRMQS